MTGQAMGSQRGAQCLLIGTFLPLCWLLMLAAHEVGHVLAAALSGGSVTKIVLHPLAISRTDVDPNPHPLWVVWAGPILGVLLPVWLWLAFRMWMSDVAFLGRFWAGFCLIANGAYIGIGSFESIGDAREMLFLNSPIWTLWLFGITTVPTGLWLWHGQGRHFGWGDSGHIVDRRIAVCVAVVLAVVVTLMLSWR